MYKLELNLCLKLCVYIVPGSRRPEHSFSASPVGVTASENLSKDVLLNRGEVPVNFSIAVYILTSHSTIEITSLEYKMQLYQALSAMVSFYCYDIEQPWKTVKKFFAHSWAPSPSQRFLPPCIDMPADLTAAINSIQWKPGQEYIFKKAISAGHVSVDDRSGKKRRHRQK